MKPRGYFVVLLLAAGCIAARGDAKVASVFTDHMVLQREKPIPIWGTAKPGEKITVEFSDQNTTAETGEDGRWQVVLDPLTASSTPRKMYVYHGVSSIRLEVSDILVGDVWLCAGQSNMKFPLKHALDGEPLVQGAGHPQLRLLQVPNKVAGRPQDRIDAAWSTATPESAAKFSAVGFVFGQRIHAETGVPIGLIQCAEGSTSVECWVSNETLEGKLFAPAVEKWREVEENWNDPRVREKHVHKSHKDDSSIQPSDARTYPGGCYNAMLHSLFPFAMKGVAWYQGEANRERSFQYRSLFPAMIEEWRERFEQDDFKFYVVQLPEIGKTLAPSGGDSVVAELREAQLLTVSNDPLMELAVIIDSDQLGNIHPKNKQLPGDRLARIALAKDYGRQIEYSGPVFREMKIEGSKARLFFDHPGGGLMVGKRTGPTRIEVEPINESLANFAVAGSDRKFHLAEAVIDGETVVVGSEDVSKPVAVRYAWADNPDGCNFYNQAGLPASPFRTDDWPCVTEGRLDGKVLIIR